MKDRVFRTVGEKLGGHWHVRIFAAERPDRTFACIGTLVMDEDDYNWFTALFACEHKTKETA